MADAHLKDIYDTQLEYQEFAAQALRDLDPDADTHPLTAYATLPEDVFDPRDIDAIALRTDAAYRTRVHDTQIDSIAVEILQKIDDAADAEIRLLAFCEAVRRHDTTGGWLPPGFANATKKDMQACTQRLNTLAALAADVHEDANEDEAWVTMRKNEKFEPEVARNMAQLRRGLDAQVLRGFLLKAAAGEHLNASHAYIEPVCMHACIAVLRLTDLNDGTPGDGEHRASVRAIDTALRHSLTLTRLAAGIYPELNGPAVYFAHPTRSNGYRPN